MRRWLRMLGPGFITGASDDDPSGVATYAIAGASFGYSLLWTALITFPLMTAVQTICARIGMVTGRGLASAFGEVLPRPVLHAAVLSLVLANTFNVAADIQAVAAAINMLAPVGIGVLIVPVGLAVLAMQIWAPYRLVVNVFKWLALALLAYVVTAFFVDPDLGGIVRGTLVPRVTLDADGIGMLVAILGTTISPYLWFWQSSQEVEEEVAEGRVSVRQRLGATDEDLTRSSKDTAFGMFASCFVMYFIILTTGATLFAEGNTEIETAADAAEALRPLAGEGARVLFALGVIGTGLLAIPVLTGSAAYGVCDVFGWQPGLNRPPKVAPQFYMVIAAATLGAMAINFLGIDPIDALFYTAVLYGLMAPPLLVLIMIVSNDRKLLGDRVNTPVLNVLGWTTTLLMLLSALALVGFWLAGT